MRLVLACAALGISAASAAAADFASCIAGSGKVDVFGAGSDGFETAHGRALYPSPAPAFVVDVTTREEIRDVVACAAEAGLGVCPRSGGHSFIGQSSCAGVVVDLWKMKDVQLSKGAADVQVGATLAEMLFYVVDKSEGKRMVGIGLCPSVGVGGYILGGGHNPYSGKLGLTCDSVQEYRYVTLDGKFVTASAKENPELFWASCGGGGGHFGVLYSIKIATAESADFDRNVYFRYEWPIQVAGEVLDKWMEYDQDGGDTWLRLEVNARTGVYGYGACWGVDSVDECEGRLKKADFFNVKGRVKHLVLKGADVSEFQLFIGPHGKWGWEKATVSAEKGFLDQNWDEAGEGINRLYSSSFWKLSGGKPSRDTLQKITNVCSQVDEAVISFTLCQWNPWAGKQRKNEGDDNAYAHRGMDAFTELIGAARLETRDAGMAELKRMEKEIKALSGNLLGGIYVSYPEFDLEPEDYSYLYWGQNLPRLSKLKAEYDPKGLFQQVQPMPYGKLACPAKMVVTGSLPKFTLDIDGYATGIRPGMQLAFAVDKGCSVSDASGADVLEVEIEGSGDGTVYEASILSNKPFSITVDGEGSKCKPSLVAVNSISCSDKFVLKDTPAARAEDESDGSRKCFPSSSTVETADRGVVRMDELAVGDSVRVASGRFSPVFFFSHQAADYSGTGFVSLTTCTDISGDSGEDGMCGANSRRRVVATSGHYLVTSGGGLKAAGSLKRGDSLAGNQIVVAVVSAGRHTGLFNPHTLEGNIVVDGVVASCYTTAVHPALARWLLTPLALLYRSAHYAPGFKGLVDFARPVSRSLAGPLELF